jgi:SPP1 family predicted phage head-tail adaptor
MRVGKLNKLITIQYKKTVTDPVNGNITEVWVDLYTLWASVDTLKLNEVFKAQAIEINATHKLTSRYRAGIDSKMRIKYGDRKFEIKNIRDLEEKHVYLDYICSELIGFGG